MLDLLLLYPFVVFGDLLRGALTQNVWTFTLVHAPFMQRLLRRMGIIRAYRVYNRARRACPAYQAFLAAHGDRRVAFGEALTLVPITTKENYVKKYPIEARCYGGAIPAHGVVIDESSGSSGTPNNWVRGPADRADIKKLLQFTFAMTYPGQQIFLVNCFALGPWATGMNVSMSLVDVAILKSIGPDVQKLENTLRTFGPRYKYLVTGYPPFIKLFLAETKLDLSAYDLLLVTGGEGMSEGLRRLFLKTFRTVLSSYGASDLDINLAVETDFTVALRARLADQPRLAMRLFGSERLPMLFQYNPLDYHIETTEAGELVFTVNRLESAAPKVRYNLGDFGGTRAFAEVATALQAEGVALETLTGRHSALPLLFVYGRGDLAVPFYGAKVFASDLDAILNDVPAVSAAFRSFKLGTVEDAALNHFLRISLELQAEATWNPASPDAAAMRQRIYEELQRLNQDFREVSKMFTAAQLILDVHPLGTGPFQGRDIRVKLDYVEKHRS